jgi:hypothetical protein
MLEIAPQMAEAVKAYPEEVRAAAYADLIKAFSGTLGVVAPQQAGKPDIESHARDDFVHGLHPRPHGNPGGRVDVAALTVADRVIPHGLRLVAAVHDGGSGGPPTAPG